MPSTSLRKFLVEGDTDKRVIPFLMEADGIKWKKDGQPPIVYIESYNGVEDLLKPGGGGSRIAGFEARSPGCHGRCEWRCLRARGGAGGWELWDQAMFAWLIERVMDNDAQGTTPDLACRAEP